MMDEKMIEEAFKKWWNSRKHGMDSERKAFQSAIKLLMPVIEKQSEALNLYKNYCPVNEEREVITTGFSHIPTNLKATKTQQFVREYFENMRGNNGSSN